MNRQPVPRRTLHRQRRALLPHLAHRRLLEQLTAARVGDKYEALQSVVAKVARAAPLPVRFSATELREAGAISAAEAKALGYCMRAFAEDEPVAVCGLQLLKTVRKREGWHYVLARR